MIKVLFVCTGNICRSPTAEGVLRHHGSLDIETDSAGIMGYHIGDAPDKRTIAAAKKRGYDLSLLRARQVSAHDFHDYDLILAMDRSHYDALISMEPQGSKAEIAMFLKYAPDCGYEDVPDPYYGGPEDFEKVLDLVEHGIQGLMRAIQ
jgi:protein-tyrosine phosphatase